MEGCTMMEEKSFDLDGILDELSSRLEDMIQDILVDQVEDAVTCAVQDVFDEALHLSLSRFEFVLNNGTIVRPREQMKVLSPDKTKLLCCHGGLRVDGSSLIVQTSTTCWEFIAYYDTKEEAVEALKKVKDAMSKNVSLLEL